MSYHALFTLVFFLAFVAMAAWVYSPSRKKDYEKLGYIALDADERTAGNLHKGDEQLVTSVVGSLSSSSLSTCWVAAACCCGITRFLQRKPPRKPRATASTAFRSATLPCPVGGCSCLSAR